MFIRFLRVNGRELVVSTALVAIFCLFQCRLTNASPTHPLSNASTPSPTVGFVVLIQPVKIKIAYGEATLPAGMRLPVVSNDTTSIRVNYMDEIQTIPLAAARFETTNKAADAALVPVAKPAPQPTSGPVPQLGISLMPGYDSGMQGGDVAMRELQLLLSPHCTEAVDLTGAGTKIYGGATYLMDADQVVGALGLGPATPSRIPLPTSGFPKNSIYFKRYDGAFEGHFNRLYLVTDAANKVVAVQLLDEHPKGKWKSAASLAAASWNTYNFISGGIRASDIVRVQALAKREGGVIAVETHMYQRVRSKIGRAMVDRYEEQEDSKLFIPIPFARIILHCAHAGLSKS